MATLHVRNFPDDVYARLKKTAEAHRRSLNNEAISVLEHVLLPHKAAASERISRARELRTGLKQGTFAAKDIDKFKRKGRQ